MKELILIITLILIPSISLGEIYKWVDEKGVVHFTDDPSQVPEKFLPKTEKIDTSSGKIDTKSESDRLPPTKKEEFYKDRLGRGEDYWKNRVEEWRNRFKESQERFDALKLKYNELTERINDSKSSAERTNLRRERDQIKNEMDRHRTQMEEAKIMLEKKIPEEAELYKAKPEWIK